MQSDLLHGALYPVLLKADPLYLYSGLGDEDKRLLEEFSGVAHTESIETSDFGPSTGDEQPWETLGQEGIAQGFIDNVQGLLNGK